MATNSVEKVLVIGHSFVRRLGTFVTVNNIHNLELENVQVTYIGRVLGRNILFIRDVEEWIQANWLAVHAYKAVILEIGSNDLLNANYKDHIKQSQEIYDLAVKFTQAGAGHVFLHETLFRQGSGAQPRRIPPGLATADDLQHPEATFHEAALDANRRLQCLVELGSNGQISFTRYRGLHKDWAHNMQDGVHVDDSRMPRYYKAVRSAAIRALKLARA